MQLADVVCEFVENVRGVLYPAFGIYVAKGRGIVDHCQKFFNFPLAGYIMPQSFQKVQPPRSEHRVHEDEVFLKEVPEALGAISLPRVSASDLT